MDLDPVPRGLKTCGSGGSKSEFNGSGSERPKKMWIRWIRIWIRIRIRIRSTGIKNVGYCRYCTDTDLGIFKKFRVSSSVADPHHACNFHANPDPDPACRFDANPDQDPNPACDFDADPDPTFHFDAYLDPSCQIEAQDLEKVLR